jgi:plasmid stabilization system protein ParE
MMKSEKSMSSGYKIFWTDEANTNYESIIEYLSIRWSIKEKTEFVRKLEKRIEVIKQFPEIFPKSNLYLNTHRAVLTEHITIYYSVEKEIIKIYSLFDVRQNPTKLKIE